MSKFSTVRYIFFLLLVLPLGVCIYFYGFATFPVFALIIGTSLFVINKQITDYCSFFIFTFIFVTILTGEIDRFLKSESYSYFYNLNSSLPKMLDLYVAILLGLILFYLILNFASKLKK